MNVYVEAILCSGVITALLFAIPCLVEEAVYAYRDYAEKIGSIEQEIDKLNEYAEPIKIEDIPMYNCRNCGAPVNLNQCACAYCNTPYGPRWPEVNEDGLRYKTTLLANNILTTNEYRKNIKRLTQIDVSYFK